MAEMLFLMLIGCLALYWQAGMRAKEQAVATASAECKRCGVLLLDQTVHQVKLSMSRDRQGRWRLWRDYAFEYTDTGEVRSRGHITLLGRRVLRVALETFNPIIH